MKTGPFARMRWLIVVAALALLALAGCGGAAGDQPQEPAGPPAADTPGDTAASEACGRLTGDPIRFVDTQFQSLWINNAVAQYIIENGYCYPAESTIVTSSVGYQSLERGQLDVHMELWRYNLWDLYVRMTESGDVLDLGNIYDESVQGWYVPTYMIKGDPERGIEATAPDLRTVEDLKRYWELFEDPKEPGKGSFINCMQGWVCGDVNAYKFYAYGLDEMFHIVTPGTAPAEDAAIMGLYQQGKPFFAYYWSPSWLVGKLDLTLLEEPEWNEACEETLAALQSDNAPYAEAPAEAGCAYRSFGIHNGVHHSLQERAPEVVDFLRAMNTGVDELNQTAAYWEDNEQLDEREIALWYLNEYPERWAQWMPDDVRARVAAALAEDS